MVFMNWFSLFAVGLLAVLPTEEEGVRRVQAHLLIDDSASALQEAAALVERYPDSRIAGESLIHALAADKREEDAFNAWHELSLKHPDLLISRHLLEEMSWGVLKKGLDSTQNGVRLALLR